MKRREFITGVSAAAAWPIAAAAQHADHPRRIGVLMPFPNSDAEAKGRVAAFYDELRRLGWADNNLRYDEHWSGSDDAERIRAHAAELAAATPDAILVNTPRALAPLQQATHTIPIVFVGISDPVGAGFIESLARPGGNTTGFTLIEFSVIGKLVDNLRAIAPNLTRVALMSNPINPSTGLYLRSFEAASKGIRSDVFPVHDAAQIESAIESIAREPNSGLLVPPDVSILRHRELVTRLTERHRLPAIYSDRAIVAGGGLMYYGADRVDQFKRAASYVDRILRGEKPADLPVQQPTKFELAINLKTAKALGLEVPAMLLARADEVIE